MEGPILSRFFTLSEFLGARLTACRSFQREKEMRRVDAARLKNATS